MILAGHLPLLQTVEQFLVDQRQQLTVPGTIADRILIVSIEDSTFDELPMWGPASLERSVYAPVLDRIASGGADAIAMDIFFAGQTPTPPGTDELAAAIERAGNVIVVSDATVTVRNAQERTIEMSFPAEAIKNAAAGVASPLLFRPDGTVRGVRVMQSADGGDQTFVALSYLLAQRAGEGSLHYDTTKRPILPIRWAGPSGTVPRIPFENVHAGDIEPDAFRNKIVFIGRWDEMEDTLKTPVGPMSGVEVHAQATATILAGTYPHSGGRVAGLVTAVALCVLLALFAVGRPAWMVWAGSAVLLILWAVFATLLFVAADLLLPMTGTALALVVSGPVLSALQSERALKSLAAFKPDWVRVHGEQIEATVLVCDLAGFTARSERDTPAEVLDMLQAFFHTVDNAVAEFGGISARRPGDAAIVFFRPDEESAHHGLRAVQAALSLQEKLPDVLDEDLGFGITLTTGQITLGFVGTNTPEPQILGDAVNVAFRLQGETRERDEPVIADWATATATDEIAQMMRPLGQVQVRNRTTPVQIFAPAANSASDGHEGDDPSS
ncbi:MAG: adenylate/guanylate cyclase domain-containing protein [Armatimonadota bacterium]